MRQNLCQVIKREEPTSRGEHSVTIATTSHAILTMFAHGGGWIAQTLQLWSSNVMFARMDF
jgi:hypothetical protein